MAENSARFMPEPAGAFPDSSGYPMPGTVRIPYNDTRTGKVERLHSFSCGD